MSAPPPPPPASDDLVAIDIGNTRVKLGLFRSPDEACLDSAGRGALPIAPPGLPEPDQTLTDTAERLAAGSLSAWFDQIAAQDGAAPPRVVIGSVCPQTEGVVTDLLDRWSADNGHPLAVERLANERMPIELRVDEPARVGVDRVAAAVAACRLRRPDTPAVVVDLGTAITVDLVSAEGAFLGGAILPGPGLAARALAEGTARLPLVRLEELDAAPDAVGRSTESALQAGLYWGAVGAIRELIARQRDGLTRPPQVFLTGGAAPSVARLIGGPDYTVRHVAHLTLAGLAVAAGPSKAGEP